MGVTAQSEGPSRKVRSHSGGGGCSSRGGAQAMVQATPGEMSSRMGSPPGGGAAADETIDQWSRNPLLCWLCDEMYNDPRLLACYHSFCNRCLTPRIIDSKISCPLCGKVSGLKDGQPPPKDILMTFLVESSCEERPPCANCDKSQGMFFCNTCGQALCGHCREETHRARMFSLHDIIHISKKGREVNKKCSIHGEPHIMFSTTKRTMLCINCFRESSVDARLHCVDLETAYGQGCKKLDRAVMLPGETLLDIDTAYTQARQKLDRAAASIRELQNSVRDGVILFKALLDELRKNTESERCSINALVDNILDTVRRTQDHLLREVDGQYDTKDKLFRSQLASLGSLLPIIQVHLLMCTTFSSSASKYEFLDLVFQLMERLAAIAHLSHPLRPGQSSQVRTNFKSEFSRALDSLLSVSSKRRGDSCTLPSGSSVCSEKQPQPSTESCTSRPPSAASVMAMNMPPSRRSLSAAKLKILESGGPFAEHCKVHEGKFRDLSTKFTQLKEETHELHRDVTLRRCLTRRGRVEEVMRECSTLEDEFHLYGDEMEELRMTFDAVWDEHIQRIYAEQEVFQNQVNDVASLRDENKRLMIIAQQLVPYIRNITALMERISPKLQVPQSQILATSQSSVMDPAESANVSSVMQHILEQITSCKPDQQQRMEAHSCPEPPGRVSSMRPEDSLMMQGIPKPPDPPHIRRNPSAEAKEDPNQAHGFSLGPASGLGGAVVPSKDKRMAALSSTTSLTAMAPSSVPGTLDGRRSSHCRDDARRKRQNSEGDTLVYREMASEMQHPRLPIRRGSEGSEVGGVLSLLLDRFRLREDKRPKSQREPVHDLEEFRCRSAGRGRRAAAERQEIKERLIDRAAASFDASAVPERPKSACENTLLRAAEKLYYAAAAAKPSGEGRRSSERVPSEGEKGRSHSRESSAGRARSAEREGGVRVPKNVPAPRLPVTCSELSKSEIRAIIHAEPGGQRVRPDITYAATVPRKCTPKKENIYENVAASHETHQLAWDRPRPTFRKQNSLDTLPSDSRSGRGMHRKNEAAAAAAVAAAVIGEGRRGTSLRKADSFEGHEEAVRTLVAAVHENRILRRKKTK